MTQIEPSVAPASAPTLVTFEYQEQAFQAQFYTGGDFMPGTRWASVIGVGPATVYLDGSVSDEELLEALQEELAKYISGVRLRVTPPYALHPQSSGLLGIADAQGRCLLLTDAHCCRALAQMVRTGVSDESRPLRSKHAPEVLFVTALPGGGVHLIRRDQAAAFHDDKRTPAQTPQSVRSRQGHQRHAANHRAGRGSGPRGLEDGGQTA